MGIHLMVVNGFRKKTIKTWNKSVKINRRFFDIHGFQDIEIINRVNTEL